jgi:tetratricopeptide (TPR) repeat protein
MKSGHFLFALLLCTPFSNEVFAQSNSAYVQAGRLGATPQLARAMASELAAAQLLSSKVDGELSSALTRLRNARSQIAELKLNKRASQAALLLVDKLAQERRATVQQFSLFYEAVFKTVSDATNLGSPELRSALLIYQLGDRDRAISALTAVLGGDDRQSRLIGARTLALIAVERVEQGGLGIEKGVQLLEAALRVDPSFNPGWVVLRIYFMQTRQWSRAEYALSNAEKTATTPNERTAVLGARADLAGFQDSPETGRLYEKAIAAFKARAMDPSADTLSWISYFDTLGLGASYAINVTHDLSTAVRYLDDAERILRAFPGASFVPERQVTIAEFRAKIAFKRSDFDGAVRFANDALKIARRLVAKNPSNEIAHSAVVHALIMRGDALAATNSTSSLSGANDSFDEAFEITKRQLAQDPDDASRQFAIENVLATWGQIPQLQQSQIWMDLRIYIETFGSKRPLTNPERQLIATSLQIAPR